MNILQKIDKSVYIIAEMSANHNGDFKRAIEIVHAAKNSGADCLKLQTYTADAMTINCDNRFFRIKGGLWDGYKLYDLYKTATTPYEWQEKIKRECDKIDMDFLSTPFDKDGVDFLDSLGVGAYKVSSFELVDLSLISHIAKKGKPIILSCGMGSIEEIDEALATILSSGLPKEQVILLKCSSEYPADTTDMNLQTIADMRHRFGVTVGLSDHSMDTLAPAVAVALGALVIEKHFCLSRTYGGVDSAFSLEPHEFRRMVDTVQEVFLIKGNIFYGPTDKENDSLVFRRSIFAVNDIRQGDIFTTDNIRVIRPGYGAKPKYYNNLLGQKSTKNIKCGEPINLEEVR